MTDLCDQKLKQVLTIAVKFLLFFNYAGMGSPGMKPDIDSIIAVMCFVNICFQIDNSQANPANTQ